nr:MAG TPA: hypothetical protein [Caudoviricetes sp.]
MMLFQPSAGAPRAVVLFTCCETLEELRESVKRIMDNE